MERGCFPVRMVQLLMSGASLPLMMRSSSFTCEEDAGIVLRSGSAEVQTAAW